MRMQCENQTARLVALAVCWAPCGALWAQTSAAPAAQAAPEQAAKPSAIPRPDQLEPGVDTSAAKSTAAPGQGDAAAASAAQAPAGAPPQAKASAPASDAAAARGTRARARAEAAKNTGADAAGAARGRKGVDRLELETTDITGNRELPKVLYIVPWKRSDLGDLVGKPPNSLLDEVLQPLDRDVFRRENRYYDALQPDGKATKGATVPPSGDKP